MDSTGILGRIVQYIVDPTILLIFSIGFLYFIWGLVVFIANPEDTTKRQTGVQHMLWGIIGMFIMIASSGIINLIIGTFNLEMPGTSSFSAPRGDTPGFPTL
ncbi:MAG: hypothetical protein HYT30_01010 [Parcubacteria group bacterium]|nr:hypothetical protein [Parcubacteria group bacterium]